jgi:threonine aldolase
VGPTAVRLVTHLDITRDDADKAAAILSRLT